MSSGEGVYRAPGRTAPARGAHIFLGGPNIFFVTVNTKDRVSWIGQPPVRAELARLWAEEATAWHVGYYLLMPDHLHLFCAPHDLHFDIERWTKFWKAQLSRMIPQIALGWQRGAFHHRIRDRLEYEAKLQYVRENPLRWGLVKQVDEWPLQGRVYDLVWSAD